MPAAGSPPSLATASLTVTVNRTGDASDRNVGDGLCDVSVNIGDQCSLRAAIEELNAQGAAASPHRIQFDISGTGPFTITPQTDLPSIVVPMEIDGETQPGAACPTTASPANLKIVLDGSRAGYGAPGLYLDYGSVGSTIRGMVIGNFDLGSIWIFGRGNHIACNHLGIGADGVTIIGNGALGLLVLGDGNTIGGQVSSSQRNVISGNSYFGIDLLGDNNTITNNFIGTTALGDQVAGNGGPGIAVMGNDNIIGGVITSARNVISGNRMSGIEVSGDRNVVLGNFIGVAVDRVTPLGNGSDGIEFIYGATGNRVGGTASGEANRIAHNTLDGVEIPSTPVVPLQNEIRGNSIFDNGDLGIDLGDDGVTPNDTGDVDVGVNELQNYPILVSAPGSAIVTGTLDSLPNTSYIVDVYRNEGCDPSGHGEGRQHLVTEQAPTDGSGEAAFDIKLAGKVSIGDGITATATDPDGNTSEFSNCVTLTRTESGSATFLPLVLR